MPTLDAAHTWQFTIDGVDVTDYVDPNSVAMTDAEGAEVDTLYLELVDPSGIPDGMVHAVITSPPYYGLRSYAGDQDVEWPSVTYRLNEWCEPVTVHDYQWINEEENDNESYSRYDANGARCLVCC